MTPPDPYLAMARDLPSDVRLGGALITMIEPDVGHERDYNRWYEDDHFYAGARSGPWCFAGRRWVAPWDLRQLRAPLDSTVLQPLQRGCYISTYWLTEGHVDDHVRWAHEAMEFDMRPSGRSFNDRTDAYSAWHDFAFAVVPGAGPLRAEHALDHPYQGLVFELLDPAPGRDRAAVHDWLRHEHLPRRAEHPAIGQSIAFVPRPYTIVLPDGLRQPDGLDTRTCVLTLLTRDPRDVWDELFAHQADEIAAGAQAALQLTAGFIPTIPGTDHYTDQLRRPAAG
jgi:hypothetical protein